MNYDCLVSDITPLRIPKVYRVRATCSEIEVEIEFHEEVVKTPQKNSSIKLEITNSKERCLAHYFCGHGYVVSNTHIDSGFRSIISLHGFLIVLRSPIKIDLVEGDKVYVGIDF